MKALLFITFFVTGLASSKEVATYGSFQYYNADQSFFTTMVENIDFSPLNLEKNYTVSITNQGPFQRYNILEEPSCKIKEDVEKLVLFKNDRVVQVNYHHNARVVSGQNCTDFDLKETITVESFLIPKKEDFKSLLIEAYGANLDESIRIKKNDSVLSDLSLFKSDDTGYVVKLSDGTRNTYHAGKVINPDCFLVENWNRFGGLITIRNGVDLTRINSQLPFEYRIYDSYYLGEYSDEMPHAHTELMHKQDTRKYKNIEDFLASEGLI